MMMMMMTFSYNVSHESNAVEFQLSIRGKGCPDCNVMYYTNDVNTL